VVPAEPLHHVHALLRHHPYRPDQRDDHEQQDEPGDQRQ
jgi:hypothetical protein